jgi:large subunit ribosomal protein L22
MEHTTTIKYVKISPKKLRFLLGGVKKMDPIRAMATLRYDNRKTSYLLLKAVKSAVDSAKKTLNIEENLLKFKILEVSEGPAIKRSRAGGRGTAKLFKRRSSHIRIVLETQEAKIQTSPSVKKEETKKAESKVTKVAEAKTKPAIKNSKPVKKTVTKKKS